MLCLYYEIIYIFYITYMYVRYYKLLGFQGVRTSTRRGCKGNFPNNPIVHDVIGIIVQQLTERKHFGMKFACNLTIQAEDKHSCSYVFLRSLIFIRHIKFNSTELATKMFIFNSISVSPRIHVPAQT